MSGQDCDDILAGVDGHLGLSLMGQSQHPLQSRDRRGRGRLTADTVPAQDRFGVGDFLLVDFIAPTVGELQRPNCLLQLIGLPILMALARVQASATGTSTSELVTSVR